MAFDIPYAVCVVIMATLTGVYVILGGYMATAINDFIQGIVMIGGIIAVIAAVLSGQGGFMEAVGKLAQFESDVPVTMGQPGAFTSFWPGSVKSSWSYYFNIVGNVGTASDGT